MEYLPLILKLCVLALVFFAAFEDFRHMRIRNKICISIALLFIPYAFLMPFNVIAVHTIVAVVIFILAALLFFFRVFGGGDAKILGALGLWITPMQLPSFLLIMALAGGALALLALLLQKSDYLSKLEKNHPKLFGPTDGWLASLSRKETVVPYGISIAFATLVTFF